MIRELLILLISSLFLQVSAVQRECPSYIFPIPHNCSMKKFNQPKKLDICKVTYQINVPEQGNNHFNEIITQYQAKSFRCKIANIVFSASKPLNEYQGEYLVEASITDPSLRSVFKVEQQSYSIVIQEQKATITTQTYVGFIRALETFTQTIQCNTTKKALSCQLTNFPIKIYNDQPQFPYRGVMIDTSRHFLPLNLIFQTIDALMYNKMSVLHWHITDEDSFPLQLESHPEIAQHSSFSKQEIYTADQAKEVVRYAMVRGVRVVPQIDTPSHASSWGRAEENKDLTCGRSEWGYRGSLDITMYRTYQVLKQVFTEINTIFVDPVLHLGGDEVQLACLKNKTEFNKEMQQNNFTKGYELYYRYKLKNIIRQINSSKQPMFWARHNESQIQESDLIHWWGSSLSLMKNKFVVSYFGPYYLDMGFGHAFGHRYNDASTWADIYNVNIKQSEYNFKKGQMMGAIACLWSQVSNKYTHHVKIWMRTSSMAERLWNSAIPFQQPKQRWALMKRMAIFERVLNRRGIPTHPITCKQCEINPENC